MSRLTKWVASRVPPISRRQTLIDSLQEQLETKTHQLHEVTKQVNAKNQELKDLKDNHARQLRELQDAADKQQTQNRRKIKRLQERVTELREAGRRTSFKTQLANYRSTNFAMGKLNDPAHLVMRQIPHKLRNYSFAQSHGINVPEVFKVWSSPDQIDLSTVSADKIVLKADGGFSGRAVWPLLRDGDHWTQVDGRLRFPNGPLPRDLVQTMKTTRGPFFAEELLVGIGSSALPEDIKLYTSYGEVLQVLVMQQNTSGSLDREMFIRSYFDQSGRELGPVLRGAKYGDVQCPELLPELVDASMRLSTAAGLSFIRVDLYMTGRGPVLGELTLAPGGRQEYLPKHDQRMGRLWAAGRARLERDIAAGRPPGMLFGPEPYDWHYPSNFNPASGPNAWPRLHASPAPWVGYEKTGPPHRT